jgi:hypothetical protein
LRLISIYLLVYALAGYDDDLEIPVGFEVLRHLDELGETGAAGRVACAKHERADHVSGKYPLGFGEGLDRCATRAPCSLRPRLRLDELAVIGHQRETATS